MKHLKLLIFALCALFLVQAAIAANTGYIISLPNGTVESGCVYVDNGDTAQEVITSIYGITTMDYTFTNGVLESLYGTSSNTTSNSTWKLWSNNGGNSFIYKDQAFTTTKVYSEYVIGISYGNSTTVSAPTYKGYYEDASEPEDEMCPIKLIFDEFSIDISEGETDFDESEIDDDAYSAEGDIDEVAPGATLTILMIFESLWEEFDEKFEGERKISIEDIEVYGEIIDADLGSDLEPEDEPNKKDVDPEDISDDIEIAWQIPWMIVEDTYELPITITSVDEIGRHYDYEINLSIDITKEDNLVRFEEADLSVSEIDCSRNVVLDYEVQNIGADDEDEVVMTLKNSNLDISKTEIFELEEYVEDSKTQKRKSTQSGSISFVVPEDAKAGSYTLELKATYNEGDEAVTVNLPLTVKDCVPYTVDDSTDSTTDSTTQTTDTQGSTNPTVQVIRPTILTDLEEEDAGFLGGNGMIILIVVAEVVVIGGIIGLIFALKKKKY